MRPKPRILLAGAGHAHLLFLKKLRARQSAQAYDISLLDSEAFFIYSGMVPGFIGGSYQFTDHTVDLRTFCEKSGVTFIQARVDSIDLEQRFLLTESSRRIPFDLISLNLGSTPAQPALGAPRNHAMTVKPFAQFYDKLANIDELIASKGRSVHLVCVGGGAAGVEIALAMRKRYGNLVEVNILEADKCILRQMPDKARTLVKRRLKELSVGVFEGRALQEIHENALLCTDGTLIPCDVAILLTNARPPECLAKIKGLALSQEGFVLVNQFLQSVSHDFLFAAGDCASMEHTKIPKSGVYSVRSAPILDKNLWAYLDKKPLSSFRPQKSAMSILNLQAEQGLLLWRALVWKSSLAWQLKDFIDRRFIKGLADF